jgi:uncharacterized membrane protein YphA (DoxX/SURF4 family)
MAATTKNASAASLTMAVARIAVGLMFLMFAQYKLLHRDFAHGGYQKYVSGWVDATSVSFYKPFLRGTLHYPVASGYAVAVAELLIGISMVLGVAVRPFAVVGALFMLNLALATWVLPAGTPPWKYLGNQLDNIPMLLLFLLFFVHRAGETLGLDGK